MAATDGVLVVGQVARDLVLAVDGWPDPGEGSAVGQRLEQLGGKGANQAVGMRQLGAGLVCVIGVVGDDHAGAAVLDQARSDGLDVTNVVRRGSTALLVDVVDGDGTRRLFEHVPADQLLTEDDVRRSSAVFDRVDTVCLQLQQPAGPLIVAAEMARERGRRVVLDGAVTGPARDRLISMADVVRANAAEAGLLVGSELSTVAEVRRAADHLLGAGPSVVALAVADTGDYVAWRGGEELIPFGGGPVRDVTGAGDAFVATLVTALRGGAPPAVAGRLAAEAAAHTVQRLGGRPALPRNLVDRFLEARDRQELR